MNKHIEEMAHDMCEYYYEGTCYQDKKPCDCKCDIFTDAEYLYGKGYRKASQEGSECPTCHGTGRIGTTDWLTKNISKEQLAKEKAEAVAEHEAQFKRDVAREIFAEIEKISLTHIDRYGRLLINGDDYAELRKKYESEGADDDQTIETDPRVC